MQHCYHPWYTREDGTPISEYKKTCDDKSDQVFPLNTTCSDIESQYLQEHNDKWCNDNLVKKKTKFGKRVCENPEQWLQDKQQKREKSEQHDPLWYIDPHNCQSSCSEADRSPDCVSCTNEEYFKCEKSQQCVHPDLVCDGHPQCDQAEDENFNMCTNDKYINRFKKPKATFPCISKMYQGKQ